MNDRSDLGWRNLIWVALAGLALCHLAYAGWQWSWESTAHCPSASPGSIVAICPPAQVRPLGAVSEVALLLGMATAVFAMLILSLRELAGGPLRIRRTA